MLLRTILFVCQSVIDDSERALILGGHVFLRTKGVQGVLEIRRVCRVLVTLFKGLIAIGGLPTITLKCVLPPRQFLSLLVFYDPFAF